MGVASSFSQSSLNNATKLSVYTAFQGTAEFFSHNLRAVKDAIFLLGMLASLNETVTSSF